MEAVYPAAVAGASNTARPSLRKVLSGRHTIETISTSSVYMAAIPSDCLRCIDEGQWIQCDGLTLQFSARPSPDAAHCQITLDAHHSLTRTAIIDVTGTSQRPATAVISGDGDQVHGRRGRSNVYHRGGILLPPRVSHRSTMNSVGG